MPQIWSAISKLGLEIQRYNVPVIYALNMVDVAKRHGLEIDIAQLSRELRAPVVPTIAVKGEGFTDLKAELAKLVSQPSASPRFVGTELDAWRRAKDIARRVRNQASEELKLPGSLRRSDAEAVTWYSYCSISYSASSLGAIVGGGKALRALLLSSPGQRCLGTLFKGLIRHVYSGRNSTQCFDW